MFDKDRCNEMIRKIFASVKARCHSCGSDARLIMKKGYPTIICGWTPCRKQRSLWLNTPLYSSKIGFEKMMEIVFLWLLKLQSRQIAAVAKVSRQTVRKFLKQAAHLILPRYYAGLESIGGPDVIVEIDESKFGKRKYNRGHSVEGVWVLGMVERTPARRIVMVPVPNRTADTLTSIIKRHVKAESIIYTDGWAAYRDLSLDFSDHCVVNHSLHFKDPITGVHSNTIEGNWCGVKMQVPHKNRTKRHIKLYLLRFMLLRNTPDTAFEEFCRLMFSSE